MSSHFKCEYYRFLESLSGTEDGGRIVRMVRRVREMLALDGNTVIVVVTASAFALRAACKPVPCIDLHPWLGGGDFEETAALRGIEFGSCLELSRLRPVYHPAVVIPLPVFEGREVFFYITA